jgi:hypothetical protein
VTKSAGDTRKRDKLKNILEISRDCTKEMTRIVTSIDVTMDVTIEMPKIQEPLTRRNAL